MTHLGYKQTEEHKQKNRLWHKGKTPRLGSHHSEETKMKIGLKSIGRVKSVEGRKRISEALSGEKNPLWKGDLVSYRNLHRWVERIKGKAKLCSRNINHKSTRYHWANISGEYKRDLNDWHQLCPSCNLTDGIRKPSKYIERRNIL